MRRDLIYKLLATTNTKRVADILKNDPGLFNQVTKRQNILNTVHAKTKTVYLREGDLYSPGFKYKDHDNLKRFKFFIDQVCGDIGLNIENIKNAIFVLLPGNKRINPHTDAGPLLEKLIRVHVPIITNDDVIFNIDGNKKNMKAGEVWVINNLKTHSVANNGDAARIHLIFDYKENIKGFT